MSPTRYHYATLLDTIFPITTYLYTNLHTQITTHPNQLYPSNPARNQNSSSYQYINPQFHFKFSWSFNLSVSVFHQYQDEILFQYAALYLIYIMMQSRIKSSKAMVMPQTRESIMRKRESWKQYHRQLFSHQNTRLIKRSISTAPFHHQISHKFLDNRPYQRQKIEQIDMQDQENAESMKFRPFTQMKNNNKIRMESPLSILRSRSKDLSQNDHKSCDNDRKIRVNFLKKGKAVDKAIIMNVLKSKLNLNVCANIFSYVNDPRNKELIKVMQKQIPKGIQDIVGVQEMIRMSHIMTGANFSSVNMIKRLNVKLRQRNQLFEKREEQDGMTLKSIKRW